MTFSAAWLAMRSGADRRARSPLVTHFAKLTDTLRRPLRVIDLGSGTGATVRELFPHIRPPQDWTLVDADADLLQVAQKNLQHYQGLRVATHHADLTVDPLWSEPPDAVTASALFDLTSQAFLDRLAEALARHRIPLLAMLTFDGRLRVEPEHPFDGAMIDAFNAHQRGMKSFGRALGPDAAGALTDTLQSVGATVEVADSPWTLTAPLDADLMNAKLDGWAETALEIMPDRAGEIRAWREARRDASAIFVGHSDHLATF
ncbi:SAM-dependent methyltransferase [Acuticoccus sediminis]|uniref:SAM-dependent methyltransferase n=1 Tax=Acuticoccus sediminis TaxID=2184697 RepID=A0A8B2P653_9HYPH|nr:class I SAM-dependent methyltransferase [Acuticoccus sediminis]RAI04049.1 SAM-dependent methyltransferase [Acuticoccus sediminis]